MQDRIKDDGGPAYPMVEKIYIKGQITEKESDGLTKRDKFAIAALQGMLANPNVVGRNHNCGWSLVNNTIDGLSNECYAMADAMLEARKK